MSAGQLDSRPKPAGRERGRRRACCCCCCSAPSVMTPSTASCSQRRRSEGRVLAVGACRLGGGSSSEDPFEDEHDECLPRPSSKETSSRPTAVERCLWSVRATERRRAILSQTQAAMMERRATCAPAPRGSERGASPCEPSAAALHASPLPLRALCRCGPSLARQTELSTSRLHLGYTSPPSPAPA